MDQLKKPVILIVSASGLTGSFLVKEFDRDSSGVCVRLATDEQTEVERFKLENKDVRLLDLDDPRSLESTLTGVDRVFLVTGYTVAMLTQEKRVVDAAKKSGVTHIVHHGTLCDRNTRDPRFALHRLIEKYIETSGIAWTHLHPEVSRERSAPMRICTDSHSSLASSRPGQLSWTSSQALAALAATVLKEGPEKHGGRSYWLSENPTNGREAIG